MKISKLLFVLLVLVIPITTIAQRNFTEEADNAFKYEQYFSAISLYKKASGKVKNKVEKKRIAFQIAECYRLTKDPKKAEQQYSRLIRAKYSDPIVYLYYAEAMRDQQKYQQAIAQFKKYIKLVPGDPRGKMGLESCQNAITWAKEPTQYGVNPLTRLNSREDDFSPVYSDKKYKSFVFTSSRKDADTDVDPNTGQPFSAIFVTQLDPRGNWSKPVVVDEKGMINTNENNGSATFNRKFNTLYFTRCVVNKKEVMGCAIYASNRRGKTWTEPTILPIADDSIRVGHPAISRNEKTMYFAANLPNGYGGRDIWVAKRRKKSKPFSKPRNLGNGINTKGNELFPTLREISDGPTYLYFSSDGRGGMGGLDLFRSEYVDGKWTKAENLGHPLNSSGDDFGMVFSKARTLVHVMPDRTKINCEEMGLFSSVRKGGRGQSDIYEFWLPEVVFTLSGVVRDESTLQYLPGSTVMLSGSDGKVLKTTTDNRGYYNFNKKQILKNVTYTLKVSHKGYFGATGTETTVGRNKTEDLKLDFKLTPIPPDPIPLPEIRYKLAMWDLQPQYQDSLNGLIQTMQDNPTIVIELASHTDFRDTDEKNDVLSQKRANEVVDYLITKGIEAGRMQAKGYGERKPRVLKNGYRFSQDGKFSGVYFPSGTTLSEEYIKSLRNNKKQEAAHQLNRRTEFRILRDDYVPQNSNDSIGTVDIAINPDDNRVRFETKRDTIFGSCVLNGTTYDFAFIEKEDDLKLSLSVVLELMGKHKLGVKDFNNGADAFTEDGTPKDGEIFVIQRLMVGSKIVYDTEAKIVHDQGAKVIFGDAVMTEFSDYSIDKDNETFIFE
ncbi:MAG: OmpA family protein [Bacteroidales bacterium]|nr:OmpA family protein [Bacteroidales bacterium]